MSGQAVAPDGKVQADGCVPCRACGGDQTRGWHLHDRAPESEKVAPMPTPPKGFEACRVGYNPQVTHLVILDSAGSNGGRPTMCRLTRFPTRGGDGETLLDADLPGWSMGGGFSGPGVEQVKCPDCYSRLTRPGTPSSGGTP